MGLAKSRILLIAAAEVGQRFRDALNSGRVIDVPSAEVLATLARRGLKPA